MKCTACGFGPRFDLGLFSRQWRAAHAQAHVAAFPMLDERSRQVLIELLEQAP